MASGEVHQVRVAFKNVGTLPWVKYGSEPVRLMALQGNAYSLRDSSWSGNHAASMMEDRVNSGQLAFFNLRLKAPQNGGLYNARFALYAGDRPIEGGMVEIPVEVRQGSVSATVPTNTTNEYAASGNRGPNIRVGLFTTTAPVTVTANGTYQLIDGRNHQPVRQLSGVTTVQFDFSTLQYTVTNGSFTWTSGYHVHLRPDDMDNTIFEIISLDKRAAWDRSVNFNKFRGDLAVHYMRSTGRLWVIEELPIEDYMRGLAETSNGSHFEYQKALVTAARTYALFVLSIGGKHKNEYHDVNTTAGDQVYKGYVSELVRPNVVRAVEETRGSMVTYNNELVVTPYFSRSDGRTRAWTEVWGGSHKPWLVSVPAPYDQGRTLWGHGVGMSALDALERAEDGASWTQILQYYYTGTQIQRAY
jgi:peptidoglycan hydrolase-like amidase